MLWIKDCKSVLRFDFSMNLSLIRNALFETMLPRPWKSLVIVDQRQYYSFKPQGKCINAISLSSVWQLQYIIFALSIDTQLSWATRLEIVPTRWPWVKEQTIVLTLMFFNGLIWSRESRTQSVERRKLQVPAESWHRDEMNPLEVRQLLPM